MLVEKEKPSKVSSSTAAYIMHSGAPLPGCDEDEMLGFDRSNPVLPTVANQIIHTFMKSDTSTMVVLLPHLELYHLYNSKTVYHLRSLPQSQAESLVLAGLPFLHASLLRVPSISYKLIANTR